MAPPCTEGPALACYYASYWSGVPTVGLEIYWREGKVIFVFPTNDARTSIAVAWPHRMFHQVRADVEGAVMAALELVPELAARVRGRAGREEPFVGTAELPCFFRTPYGPLGAGGRRRLPQRPVPGPGHLRRLA